MSRILRPPTRATNRFANRSADSGESSSSRPQGGWGKAIRNRLRIRTRLLTAARRAWPPKMRPVILMYHRIADEPVDPWGLAVAPQRFAEQLRVLGATRRCVSLSDFVRSLADGTLAPNAAAVTFDDGYADNLVAGKPLLSAADIPATVFLTTGYVDRADGFWWDELAKIVLLGRARPYFELMIHDETVRFDFSTDVAESCNTTADLAKRRRSVLESLRRALLLLSSADREHVMAQLRRIFPDRDFRAESGRVLTGAEVREIASDGLVTIGAHTVTHPCLPGLKASDRQREIIESKRTCEALIGKPVTTFAYPYGEFDVETSETVRSAGFVCACSMLSGPANPAANAFALPRLHVSNLNGEDFERALRFSSVAN